MTLDSMCENGAERRRVAEFLSALRTPCRVSMHPQSPLNTPAFEAEFRSKLLVHHQFVGSPLFQESFDSAFISACTQAGFSVEKAASGQRFWDILLEGRRISLKSSKARDLRQGALHISKLTEAAWLQDCRGPGMRRQRTRALFERYCDEVEAIVQLRYFQSFFCYELVEIPVSLFRQVLDVARIHFRADSPVIRVPVGQTPADFTLKLDRSDAKVTIANINRAVCLVHGTWQL